MKKLNLTLDHYYYVYLNETGNFVINKISKRNCEKNLKNNQDNYNEIIQMILKTYKLKIDLAKYETLNQLLDIFKKIED